MADPTFPSIVFGTISSDERTVGGITVNVKNTRTGESLQTTTEKHGEYAIDAANYSNGYEVGDTVEVSVTTDFAMFDANVNIDNGKLELK